MVDEPLIRRAWVVQERLLAPRVLHFGSRQLFWECSEWDASEDYPMGIPPVLVRSDQQSLFKFFNEIVVRLMESEHPKPAHAVWQRALSSYPQASLTKYEDKLIALAGITSELSANFSDGYIADLWKQYMATELLWYVDMDTVSSKQTKYRAPSFSWASVDGAIIPGGWQKDDVLTNIQNAFASTEMSTLRRTSNRRGRCGVARYSWTRRRRRSSWKNRGSCWERTSNWMMTVCLMIMMRGRGMCIAW